MSAFGHWRCAAILQIAALCVITCNSSADAEPAIGQWTGNFSTGSFDGYVTDLHEYNGQLYAAGAFRALDGTRVHGFARLDSGVWKPMPSDGATWIEQLATYQGELVASGSFTLESGERVPSIARRINDHWAVAPETIGVDTVRATAEFDGELYIAALASFRDGQFVLDPMYRWDGEHLESLPNPGGYVQSLLVFDGALYASGMFGVARWTGDAWKSMGLDAFTSVCLVEHEGTLYAGTDGYGYDSVWMLNEGEWSSLPSTVAAQGPGKLVSTPMGLLACGVFNEIDSTLAQSVARWDGHRWRAVGAGLWPTVLDMVWHNGVVYAAGEISASGPMRVNSVAQLVGDTWLGFGNVGQGLTHSPECVAVHHQALVAGGGWIGFGDSSARTAAAWNGQRWSPMSVGSSTTFQHMVSAGGALYASGAIWIEGATYQQFTLSRQDGLLWLPVSEVFGVRGYTSKLLADDEDVIVLGDLSVSINDGVAHTVTSQVTRYSPGGCLTPMGLTNGYVNDGVMTPDGLIVCGDFTTIDGIPAQGLAIRAAGGWREITRGASYEAPRAIAISSNLLYIATNRSVEVWNGTTWSVYLTTHMDAPVLCVYDGHVFLGGHRDAIFEVTSEGLVPLAGSPEGRTEHLIVYDDGHGPAMYVFGEFSFADGRAASRVAQFTTGVIRADANGDHRVDTRDLSVLLSSFGRSTLNPYSGADFTGDARVDGADLSVLLSRFGAESK